MVSKREQVLSPAQLAQLARATDFSPHPGAKAVLIPVLRRRTFDFSFVANGTTFSTIVLPALAIAPFSSVMLLVRTHKLTITNAGVGFTVNLFEVDPSPDDGADFIVAGSAFLTSTVIDSSVTAPRLTKDTGAGTPPGPYLRVVVTGEMPVGGPGGSKMVASLSADLLCRSRV